MGGQEDARRAFVVGCCGPPETALALALERAAEKPSGSAAVALAPGRLLEGPRTGCTMEPKLIRLLGVLRLAA
jgi:hypothetical protein